MSYICALSYFGIILGKNIFFKKVGKFHIMVLIIILYYTILMKIETFAKRLTVVPSLGNKQKDLTRYWASEKVSTLFFYSGLFCIILNRNVYHIHKHYTYIIHIAILLTFYDKILNVFLIHYVLFTFWDIPIYFKIAKKKVHSSFNYNPLTCIFLKKKKVDS